MECRRSALLVLLYAVCLVGVCHVCTPAAAASTVSGLPTSPQPAAGSAADPIQLHLGEDLVPTVVGGGSTANTTSSPTPAQAQQQEHATTTKKGAHHRLSKGFLQHPDHKALLPIELKDVALFLLSFMVLGLAAGAGIGGGVLLVPMLSLITGFNPIQTVALSNVTILAGAITNAMFNMPRKNPFKPGPIIDYDLLLLFGPPIVMGSIAGSYINYFVPGWVTKLLVLLVLSPMTYRMICKARMLWVAETRRVSCINNNNNNNNTATTASNTATNVSLVMGSSMDLVVSVPEDQELTGEHMEASLAVGAAAAGAGGATAAAGCGETVGDAVRRVQTHLAPVATGSTAHNAAAGGAAGRPASSSPFPFLGSTHTPVVSPTAAAAAAGQHQHRVEQQQSADTGFSGGQQQQQQPLLLLGHNSGAQAPTRSHSHSNMLAALGETLSDRPPTLADLLGPYFLLLTDDKAADATLQAQALGRAAGGSMQLQPSGSVTRRHTLDAFQNSQPVGGVGAAAGGPNNNSSRYMYNAGGSRPSSAPTVPSEWECQGDLATDLLGDSDSAGHAAGGVGGVGMHKRHGHHLVDPLSIISPFQLYQQQRCQQQHTAGKTGTDGGEQQQQQEKLLLSAQPSLDKQQLPVCAKRKCRLLVHAGCLHTPELEDKMRGVIHHHATAQAPKTHLAALILMLVTVIVTSVAATLELTCGTWEYWLLVMTPLPLMLVVWAAMRWHVLWRVGWQDVLGMAHPTDIRWTASSTLTYPAVVITVGVMAGMLGLGGGIVLAPLLLEMGVQPAVSATSSQAAMLMSSCTSTVVYLVAGAVPEDYGIAMAIIGFAGTLFGQVATAQLVQRTGRSSILVLILAILFVLATGASVLVVSNAFTAIVHAPAKLTATHALEICTMRGQ